MYIYLFSKINIPNQNLKLQYKVKSQEYLIDNFLYVHIKNSCPKLPDQSGLVILYIHILSEIYFYSRREHSMTKT